MEAPPRPKPGPAAAATTQEEEEEETCFLASLAAATSNTATSSSSNRSMKAALSLLPASQDFMAFQGFVSLGVCASRREGKVVVGEGGRLGHGRTYVILPLTARPSPFYIHSHISCPWPSPARPREAVSCCRLFEGMLGCERFGSRKGG